ncbi:MotE family protein [Palleronia sp. KMU-117]|uniref:MotE family protein n=1 Tax=Palleronia sp. KMU-117 TaxID=3434108 RepID=UPI003D75EBB4
MRVVSGPAIALAEEIAVSRREDAPPPGGAPIEDELAALLADLRGREADVAERERVAATRLAAAQLAEERARATLSELLAAEEALRATMALADSAAENDLVQLTTVYENMKPQQAAPLFQQMAPDFAAGFLGRMRPDAAAAILSGLTPDSAYAISVILAGRNADVPRSAPDGAASDAPSRTP